MKPATFVVVATLAGCASPQPVSRTVIPATTADVAHCRYLDDVVGTSGLYGVFATAGADSARAAALERSEAIGATHIVWLPATITYGSTAAVAKAYRCP